MRGKLNLGGNWFRGHVGKVTRWRGEMQRHARSAGPTNEFSWRGFGWHGGMGRWRYVFPLNSCHLASLAPKLVPLANETRANFYPKSQGFTFPNFQSIREVYALNAQGLNDSCGSFAWFRPGG